MTPTQFLALARTSANAADGRIYRAMTEGSNETFLTLHMTDGKYHCPTYAHLGFMTGDDRGGTFIKLVFKLPVIIRGRQLQPVFEAIRTRRAAHLYEFDSGRYNHPEPVGAVITLIEFEIAKSG